MASRKPTSIGIDPVTGRPLTCVDCNGRVRLVLIEQPHDPAHITCDPARSYEDLGGLPFANCIAVQQVIDGSLLRYDDA